MPPTVRDGGMKSVLQAVTLGVRLRSHRRSSFSHTGSADFTTLTSNVENIGQKVGEDFKQQVVENYNFFEHLTLSTPLSKAWDLFSDLLFLGLQIHNWNYNIIFRLYNEKIFILIFVNIFMIKTLINLYYSKLNKCNTFNLINLI